MGTSSMYHMCFSIKVGSVTEVIPRRQEILFSLIGEIMGRLTTLEL